MLFRKAEPTRYPALILGWLTPFYDLFVRILLRERQFKGALSACADIRPGDHVLDLGAGTGTLAIMIKQRQPTARVTGLDADRVVLEIARQKAYRLGVRIGVTLGTATALPYPDGLFDRVVSSLMLSMLSSERKQRTLHEAYRVLRPGGHLHIADFAPPRTRWGRLVARRMRRFEPISDNLDGRLPVMFLAAGFQYVEEVASFTVPFGTLSILSGRKPD